MQVITRHTIKALEACVDGDYLIADKVKKLSSGMQYRYPPASLYLGFTDDTVLRKNLCVAYYMILGTKQPGQIIRAMNQFTSGLFVKTSSTEFIEEIYQTYLTLQSAERERFRKWALCLLLAEMIGLDKKVNSRDTYISHCVNHKLIDTFGLCFTLKRLKDIRDYHGQLFSRFIDVSWLGTSVIKDLAGWAYDSLADDKCTLDGIHQSFVILNRSKSSIPLSARTSTHQLLDAVDKLHRRPFDTKKMHVYLQTKDGEPKDILQLDIWMTDWFVFNKRRKTANHKPKQIEFQGMRSRQDKQIIKTYALYLLENTPCSFSCIISKVQTIQHTLNVMNVSIKEVTTKMTIDYCDKLYKERESISGAENAIHYLSRTITDLSVFYKYLCVHNIVTSNPWAYVQKSYKPEQSKIHRRAIPPYVLQQMFKVLPEIDDRKYLLIFLVMFDAGLRTVDAVALRKQDLVVFGRTNSRGEFVITGAQLNYYNHKFNHEAVVFISGTMAMLLDQWRHTQDNNSEYMFNSAVNKAEPICKSTFRVKMKEFFKSKGVHNADGTLFNFKPHDLRHTCAVRMYDAGIPIANISAQLDHQSIEMTLKYIDSIDRSIEKKNTDYINLKGEKVDPVISIDDEAGSQETIKQAVNKLRRIMLPNGICNRPALLSPCPHGCACLTCSSFATSAEYLQVHRVQLREEEKLLAEAVSAPEKATHEKNIQALQAIIGRLEATQDTKPRKQPTKAIRNERTSHETIQG